VNYPAPVTRQASTPITSADEIKEILKSHAFVQAGHAIAAPHFLEETVVLLDGESHLQRRRMESLLFTQSAVAQFHKNALVPVIDASLDGLSATRGGDEQISADLVKLSWAMLHQVAARVVGIDGVTTAEATQRFIGYVRTYGEALTVEFSTRPQGQVIEDGMAALTSMTREFLAPSAARRKELAKEAHDGRISRDELPLDLLTLLYLHFDPTWDDQLPLREAALFAVGSSQTTAQALPRLMMQLEQWFELHPDDRECALSDADFLRRAANESLRFFVASPARFRVATEDTTLTSSGRKISAGERFGLYFLPANADPNLFGIDAKDFNPRRDVLHAPWGIAFGSGPHTCPGRPLVTGHGATGSPEGTLATIARKLYEAGFELDPTNPPVRASGTLYDNFESVPVRFARRSAGG
jgi:cytochrome P450